MAQAWWNPFTWGQDSEDEERKRREREESQRRAISSAPATPQSLTGFPIGKDLEAKLRGGMAGKGQGFDPSFVDRTASPLIAQRQARYQRTERPQAEAAFSSRGLGRSSIAGRELGELGQAKERDIDSILGNAYMQNEQQKKLDEARYMQGSQQFLGAESAQQRGATADIMGRQRQLQGVDLQAEQFRQQDQAQSQQDLNKLIGTALAIGAAPFTGGASLIGLAGVVAGGGGGTAQQGQSVLDFMKKSQQTTTAKEASPFTSKNLPFQGFYDTIKGAGAISAR